MQAYVVGGAVRDALLGMPVQDRDWVVVGATPEQMVAQGFRPVGKDFPVFLHPDTHEEYALARTERKTAPGYRGFVFHTSPEVTLEEDLVRRDLTINAMARADDGTLVDPFGGQRDLQAKLFRHVSDAFLEDPVRILRVARFSARFPQFRVAPETNALMRTMVELGEADALVPERVWQELERGLMETAPSRMLLVLRECGALARIMPELEQHWDAALPALVDRAAAGAHGLCVRYAVLVQGLGGAAADALCRRLKAPNDCRDLALLSAREAPALARILDGGAQAVVKLFERCDGFRKPQRFGEMLQACALAKSELSESTVTFLLRALDAALAVDAGAVALACGPNKAAIPAAVHAARVAAVQGLLPT